MEGKITYDQLRRKGAVRARGHDSDGTKGVPTALGLAYMFIWASMCPNNGCIA
jgi:hypothetical protein